MLRRRRRLRPRRSFASRPSYGAPPTLSQRLRQPMCWSLVRRHGCLFSILNLMCALTMVALAATPLGGMGYATNAGPWLTIMAMACTSIRTLIAGTASNRPWSLAKCDL
jgi:hypothetical protein